MKGIYLTPEGKQEIEAEIVELEETYREYALWEEKYGELQTLKTILSSAIILPVYSNWEDVELYPPDNESQNAKTLELKNGVIIQPK